MRELKYEFTLWILFILIIGFIIFIGFFIEDYIEPHNLYKNLKLKIINNTTNNLTLKLKGQKLKYLQHVQSYGKTIINNITEPVQVNIIELNKNFIISDTDINNIANLHINVTDTSTIVQNIYHKQRNKYKINTFTINNDDDHVEQPYKIILYSQDKILTEIHSSEKIIALNNLFAHDADIMIEIHYLGNILTKHINYNKNNIINWTTQQINIA